MTTPDNAVTGDQVERLIESNDRNTDASVKLALATTEYQERARLARSRFRTTMVVIGAVALALLGGILVLFVKISDSLDASQSARDTILDCVQPTGECAQRSNQQLARTIAGLEQNSVLAAVCAARYTHLPVDKAILATSRCVRTHTSPIVGPSAPSGTNTPGAAPPPLSPPPTSSPSPTAPGQKGGRPTKSHKPPSPSPSSSGEGLCIPVSTLPALPIPLPSLPVLC